MDSRGCVRYSSAWISTIKCGPNDRITLASTLRLQPSNFQMRVPCPRRCWIGKPKACGGVLATAGRLGQSMRQFSESVPNAFQPHPPFRRVSLYILPSCPVQPKVRAWWPCQPAATACNAANVGSCILSPPRVRLAGRPWQKVETALDIDPRSGWCSGGADS